MKLPATITVARAVITDRTNYGVTRMSSIVQKSSVRVFVPRGLAVVMFVALHMTATEFYSAIFSDRIKFAQNSSDISMRLTLEVKTGGACLSVRQKARPDAVFARAVNSRTKATAEMVNTILLTFSENTNPPEH